MQVFRVNVCSSQREIEEIQAAVKMPQNQDPTDNAMANTEYTCRC
jgi:predicted FMN-binding regulatory protein PaiB